MQGNLSNTASPYSSIDYASLAFPAFAPPALAVCNADLPNDSTLTRFLWVIQYYNQMVRHCSSQLFRSFRLCPA